MSFVLAQSRASAGGSRSPLQPTAPAVGPLAGLTALTHVATAPPGQTMGWRGLPRSPRKAFLLLLPAMGFACHQELAPLKHQGGLKKKQQKTHRK